MNMAPDDSTLIRYLLGELPSDQAEPLDEQSIVDDAFVARLDAVEGDLVDAYVRNELSAQTLKRFQSFYLSSPRRVRRVEFARALVEVRPAESRTSEREAVRENPRWAWLSLTRSWG